MKIGVIVFLIPNGDNYRISEFLEKTKDSIFRGQKGLFGYKARFSIVNA